VEWKWFLNCVASSDKHRSVAIPAALRSDREGAQESQGDCFVTSLPRNSVRSKLQDIETEARRVKS
jgi:hypothetical protein